METAELIVDTTRAGVTASKAVWTEIYLDVCGRPFPATGWTDFTVVVLGWWATALAGLATHGADQAVRFMEGPYQVKLSAGSGTTWRLTAILGRLNGDEVVEDITFEPSALIASCIACGEAVLQLCADNDWESRDVEDLQRALAALRAAPRPA